MKTSLHAAIATLLFAAMLGASPGALAQLSATSSFDSFAYQLIDLNVCDGIDPSVSFLDDSSVNGWALLRDINGAVRESVQDGSRGERPVQVRIDTGDAYLAGDATPTSASSLVTIRGGIADTNTDSFLGFVLAPYTQVTFTIDARATASAAGSPNYAFATVAVNGTVTDEDGNHILETDGLSSYLASSDTLSVTLRSAGVARMGTLEFATAAHALLQPVPEPASMAMLVVGLAVVGGYARRRSARGAYSRAVCM
ncbi:PEP-CTERM sorting domain-containing protein [Massilia sp. Root335]|uniref:PEP-CTERM sorting domain-containing protein n=1 Tax=Massilia sp. Root335 TaxID=1736517 RepID=UPI0009E71F51|nr:PEP-CTERM sorting domain-containing protein [Massilia sp. Root335]